jgi:hypothetical protein
MSHDNDKAEGRESTNAISLLKGSISRLGSQVLTFRRRLPDEINFVIDILAVILFLIGLGSAVMSSMNHGIVNQAAGSVAIIYSLIYIFAAGILWASSPYHSPYHH